MPPKIRRAGAAPPPKKAGTSTSTKTPAKATTAKKPETKPEEPKKEEVAPSVPVQSEAHKVAVKAIKLQLVEDANRKIRDSKKAAFVIDNEEGIARRFLTYSGCTVLEAIDLLKGTMNENIRQAALGALRQGKPLIIDMDVCDIEQYEALAKVFDQVQEGLLENLCSRKISENKKYEELIDSEKDGETYQSFYFMPDTLEQFFMVFIVKNKSPSQAIWKKFFIIEIEG